MIAAAYEAIELLQAFEPDDGYYGCFSGGKDSIVIKELARLADVLVEWNYNQTTIDPPEVVRFIRETHPDVIWHKSKYGNFFHRMEEKAYIPTRQSRWCCDEFKERRPPKGALMLMGIRAEESAGRAKSWDVIGKHKRANRDVVNPIFNWDAESLWIFIKQQGLAYPSLYNEGFHRLGCIGCPLANKYAREREFKRWPGFKRRWQLSFRRIWEKRAGTKQDDGKEWFGSACFDEWQELWNWWHSGRNLPDPNQLKLPFSGDLEKKKHPQPQSNSGNY